LKNKKVMFIVLGILVLIVGIVGVVVFNILKEDSFDDKDKVYKENEMYVGTDFIITMSDVDTNYSAWHMNPDDQYKYILVKFEVKNKSKVNKLVGKYYFNGYVDGKKLNISSTNNTGLQDMELQKELQHNDILEGYLVYQVPTNSNKLIIKFKKDAGKTVKFIVNY